MWQVPCVGFVGFAIIMISWMAQLRLSFGIPVGLAAIIVGSVFAWVAFLLNWSGLMESNTVGKALAQFGLWLSTHSRDLLIG
jgi:AGZA family xanthine/uracil permease-like MFS transporter